MNQRIGPVYDYSDYRTYLRDLYAFKKANNPSVSYESFAKSLGLQDNSSIIKVLRGSRGAGKKMTNQIVASLKLGSREATYFRELVELSKIPSNHPRYAKSLERLNSIHPQRESKLITDAEFSAISAWYFYAIRQMTKLKGFESKPSWIKSKLRFSCDLRQIKDAISAMISLRLLIRDDKNGQLRLGTGRVETTTNIASEGLQRFHEQMLDRAKLSIRKMPVTDRFLTGFTFGVSKDRYKEATERLDQMLESFCDEFETQLPDEIMQLQVQFFPLTKNTKGVVK